LSKKTDHLGKKGEGGQRASEEARTHQSNPRDAHYRDLKTLANDLLAREEHSIGKESNFLNTLAAVSNK